MLRSLPTTGCRAQWPGASQAVEHRERKSEILHTFRHLSPRRRNSVAERFVACLIGSTACIGRASLPIRLIATLGNLAVCSSNKNLGHRQTPVIGLSTEMIGAVRCKCGWCTKFASNSVTTCGHSVRPRSSSQSFGRASYIDFIMAVAQT